MLSLWGAVQYENWVHHMCLVMAGKFEIKAPSGGHRHKCNFLLYEHSWTVKSHIQA